MSAQSIEVPPLPLGGDYGVILCDPPWHYNSRDSERSRFGRGVHRHYATMRPDEIFALPIADLAAERAVLFLWATFPRLPVALAAIERWGFRYVTIGFIWVKTNRRNGRPFFGPGYYSKANAEPCLLATRGGASKPAVDTVSSVVISPRREHSRKPDEVRERIAALYPTARRVELFARERADGWDAWGNEVGSIDWSERRGLPLRAAAPSPQPALPFAEVAP